MQTLQIELEYGGHSWILNERDTPKTHYSRLRGLKQQQQQLFFPCKLSFIVQFFFSFRSLNLSTQCTVLISFVSVFHVYRFM